MLSFWFLVRTLLISAVVGSVTGIVAQEISAKIIGGLK